MKHEVCPKLASVLVVISQQLQAHWSWQGVWIRLQPTLVLSQWCLDAAGQWALEVPVRVFPRGALHAGPPVSRHAQRIREPWALAEAAAAAPGPQSRRLVDGIDWDCHVAELAIDGAHPEQNARRGGVDDKVDGLVPLDRLIEDVVGGVGRRRLRIPPSPCLHIEVFVADQVDVQALRLHHDDAQAEGRVILRAGEGEAHIHDTPTNGEDAAA
mmetsp:Transcript_25862/g.65821  ORF Transcript_25862/g.65821 Transcript_25862/m.65821 type:complete len:213 (-) Transcript_25862:266-904(-)